MTDPQISVCIVTYEREEYIGRVLRSLNQFTGNDVEIVIVDDGDSNEIPAILEQTSAPHFETKYVDRDGENSMPGARNTAIDHSSGDIVCFIDDDVVCGVEWLPSVLETFEDNPDIAGVGGPVLSVDEYLVPIVNISRSRENLNVINEFGETRSRAQSWVPPKPTETQRLGGANMAFRREVLTEHGGFRKAFGRGMAKYEETDLMARLVLAREKLIFHPKALVFHYRAPEGGARSAIEQSVEEHYWRARNAMLLRKRNFRNKLAQSIFRLIGKSVASPSNWIWTLKSIKSGNPAPFYSIKGYLDGFIFDW